MDAVTAAHYRVNAVSIGDRRFAKAEHGVHDPFGCVAGGWDTRQAPVTSQLTSYSLLTTGNESMFAGSFYNWRWVCDLRQLPLQRTQRDLAPTGRRLLG